jgi:hypothetical protein
MLRHSLLKSLDVVNTILCIRFIFLLEEVAQPIGRLQVSQGRTELALIVK